MIKETILQYTLRIQAVYTKDISKIPIVEPDLIESMVLMGVDNV